MPSARRARAISRSGRCAFFVLHHAGAGDDAEIRVSRQHRRQLVGHAVGKIVLGWVAREIVQRENRERADIGRCEFVPVDQISPAVGSGGEEGDRRHGEPKQPPRLAAFGSMRWCRCDAGVLCGLRQRCEVQGRGFCGGWRFRLLRNNGDRRDQTVSLALDGLDILRMVRIVAQAMAELADGGIDAVLGVDEDLSRPEPPGDFRARHQAALARGQQDQQLHGFALDAQRMAVAAQLEAAAVQLELADLHDGAGQGAGHGNLLRGGKVAPVWHGSAGCESA